MEAPQLASLDDAYFDPDMSLFLEDELASPAAPEVAPTLEPASRAPAIDLTPPPSPDAQPSPALWETLEGAAASPLSAAVHEAPEDDEEGWDCEALLLSDEDEFTIDDGPDWFAIERDGIEAADLPGEPEEALLDAEDFDGIEALADEWIEEEEPLASWDQHADGEGFVSWADDLDWKGRPADEAPEEPVLLARRAAILVALRPAYALARRAADHRRLQTVLEEFPWASSFTAVQRLMAAGATIDNIEACCEVKILWRDGPALWKERRFQRGHGGWVIDSHPRHRHAMTWILAAQLVERFGAAEVGRLIEEEWLTDWTNLGGDPFAALQARDDGFFAFARYLAALHPPPLLRPSRAWRHGGMGDRAHSARGLFAEAEDRRGIAL